MRVSTVADSPVTVAVGKHFYQFYKGQEDFLRIVIPFLRLGLESGNACLWVVSRSVGILDAIEAFQRQCDLTRFLQKGQLVILPAERWYLDRGYFSEGRVLERLKNFIRTTEQRGFSAFRGVGDIGWLDGKDWGKLQAYEDKVQQWIQTVKITALCAYPIGQCSLTQTKDVLDRHDSVFLTKL